MIGDRGSGPYAARARVFSAAVLVVLSLLMGRLVQLQLVDASDYTGESRSNAVREIRVLPARGTVQDRNGNVVVDNQPSYSLMVTPRYFEAAKAGALASLLDMDLAELEERIDQAAEWNSYLPSPILHGVPFDRLGRVMEQIDQLPGVSYESSQKRRYPTPIRASHVLGYVREIGGDDLSQRREDGYRSGDMIGQRGIERIYENPLRGVLGSDFRLRNVHRQDVSPFRDGAEDVDPNPGRDLRLTIDSDLQMLAESLFVGKRGSAVALDPNNGEVLALVSKPDFDLAQFTGRISEESWRGLNASIEKPLFNRATQSELMPGSTWKPLIALIALQEGAISPRETVYCPGYHEIGRGRFFRCMHVHGSVDVVEALKESCNTFFFEMMRRVDVNTFARYARAFGFGQALEKDLTEAAGGLIPDSTYLDRLAGGWALGDVMNLGVGQGLQLVTPMQLARYTAALANKGRVYTPHLVRELEDPDTKIFEPVAPLPAHDVEIDESYMDMVREAMRRVMVSGTGWFLNIPGHNSAAKTGTAENSRGQDDSVFIMFAPFDNPRIALAVVVENAGFGATYAGRIASLMAEQYLNGEVTRPEVVNLVLTQESDPLPEPDPVPESTEAEGS